MTIILVGASVANCSEGILNAGMKLQAAAFGLHLFGGAVGYWMMRLLGYDETAGGTTRRRPFHSIHTRVLPCPSACSLDSLKAARL